MFMEAGSAGELGRRHGMEQVGFWRKMLEHPSLRRVLARSGDGQDSGRPAAEGSGHAGRIAFGTRKTFTERIAVYKAIKPKDTNNDKVFLVLGPWHHGQEIEDGSTLGALKFNSDTALYFRQEILRPFLDHYLKDDAPKADVPPVTAFETGTNVWRRLPAWPAGCLRLHGKADATLS